MGYITLMFFPVLVLVLMRIKPCRPQDDHQDAFYHYTKLRGKNDEFKRSPEVTSPHHVVKRAAGRKRRIHADDLILNSLASFCSHFNTDPDIAKYMETKARREPLSSRDMGGHTLYVPAVRLPPGTLGFDAFPSSILAQKVEGKVWIVFNIVHSSTVRVSRLDFDDFQEIVLEFPEFACQKVVSKARFVLPNKDCDKSEHFKIDLGGNTNAVYLYVNVCELMNTKKTAIVTTKVGIPFFRLETPSTTDKFDKYIFLENDNKNGTIFDVELLLPNTSVLEASLILWDWKSKETLQSTANVLFISDVNNTDSGILSVIEYNKANVDKQRQLFTVESLGSRSADSSDEKNAYFAGKECVRLRINIDSMSGRSVSGKITFLEIPQLIKQSDGVVSAVELMVPLVRPEWRQKVLPQDFIYFSDITRFRCSRDAGNLDLKSTGEDTKCVVKCRAYGVSISFIGITKQTPSKLEGRFKAGSYLLANSATAILDVGQAEDDVEGDYECIVVNKRGQIKKQNLKLYTKLLTKVTEVTLESVAEEMIKITCEVHGDQSVEISISVSDYNRENETFFNISNYSPAFNESESGKTLSIIVPWKELKLPRDTILYCRAEGNRGADENRVSLYDYFRTHGFFPSVELRRSFFGNFNVNLTCSFTGARPLRISLSVKKETSPPVPELVVLDQVVKIGDAKDEVAINYALSPYLYASVQRNTVFILNCSAENMFESVPYYQHLIY